MAEIAILDAGAQYGKVIDRRVRELNVESDFPIPLTASSSELSKYKGFIISGGPGSVYDDSAVDFNPDIFHLGKPILGICYGMHLINYFFEGKVVKKGRREDCETYITISTNNDLFYGLDEKQQILMSHGDSIDILADGFESIADSSGLIAAIMNKGKKMYGTQFHPEVDLTLNGKEILHNFLFRICKCDGDYTMENRVDSALRNIKDRVGKDKVLILVSGGVDSTVAVTLLSKALNPDQIYAIHIDNGFMRKNESIKVYETLRSLGLDLKNLRVINAAQEFYKASENGIILDQVIEPEVKRRIIGDTFMRIAEREISKLGLNLDETFLAQGTLRPDLIESANPYASEKATRIKTHHNDTQLVREKREKGMIVEPNRDLHKDEVRKVGEILNLPKEIVWRQPFPGPGLAVRIICAKEPYIDNDFDDINKELGEIINKDLSAFLLPIKTVGVQGDSRTYSYLATLSGISDWKTLKEIANEIPKEIHKINRVVYLFGDKLSKSPQEITPTTLTPNAIIQLQEADDVVNKFLLEYDLIRSLSQVPVISFPINFGLFGNRSIGIRTFITNDFMTGVPAIPGKEIPEECLDKIVKSLSKIPGISKIAYDLTSKPPGTVEWE